MARERSFGLPAYSRPLRKPLKRACWLTGEQRFERALPGRGFQVMKSSAAVPANRVMPLNLLTRSAIRGVGDMTPRSDPTVRAS